VRTSPPGLVCHQIELRPGSPKRGIYKRARRGRSDAGPDNGQDIVSKIRE
jgi:hypothetical protein